jgi:hypothetical protein
MPKFYVCIISHAEYGIPRDAPDVSAETVFEEWVPRFTDLVDQIELAGALIRAGFEASSTVIALPGKYVAWVELLDYLGLPIERCLLSTHQPSSHPFRPYRVSYSGMARRGRSELVEFPVIGYLGKWDHADFANSPPYDLLVGAKELVPRNWIAERYLAYEQDTGRPFPGLGQRWESRGEVDVDIWPTFFHPFEMTRNRLARTETLLREVSTWEGVCFASALEAARAWKQANPVERSGETISAGTSPDR